MTAVLRAAGLEVRIARQNHLAKVGEIVTGNPRCPFWGTVVIDPGILALWWDLYAPVDDESSAVAVTAAIIAWMASTPGTPVPKGVRLRILPPPEDSSAESTRCEVQRGGEGT